MNGPKKIVIDFFKANEITNWFSYCLAITVKNSSLSFLRISFVNLAQNFSELYLIFLETKLLVYSNDQRGLINFIPKTLFFGYEKALNFIKVSYIN